MIASPKLTSAGLEIINAGFPKLAAHLIKQGYQPHTEAPELLTPNQSLFALFPAIGISEIDYGILTIYPPKKGESEAKRFQKDTEALNFFKTL
jgi:hypothetical protein